MVLINLLIKPRDHVWKERPQILLVVASIPLNLLLHLQRLVSQSFKMFEWSMTGQPATNSQPYSEICETRVPELCDLAT